MSGLLADFLPALFSRIDATKRTTADALRQLVTDPQGLLAMRGAQLQEATQPLNGLLSGDPEKEAEASRAMDAMGPGLLGMTVFHGSPHKFDAFDPTKIGTGEGAQVYGHGLYFAENPKVAQEYKNALGGDNGKLYSVDLPDEAVAKMLDYDKPLSQQPANVQSALKDVYTKRGFPLDDAGNPLTFASDPDGQSLHAYLAASLQGRGNNSAGQAAAAEMLQSLGVPGIRYLDQGSRAAGGTSNFVVFPRAAGLLKILGVE